MSKDSGEAERKRAADFQAGLDKAKANLKARQAARKANTDEDVEVKSINKALMKKRNNPQEKDKDINKINKSLSKMRGEAIKEMKKPSSDHLAKIGITPVSKMTPAQKKADAERRKEYAAFQKSKGITPFVPHPSKANESVNEEDATEALDMKQRLARGRSARKNKAKLAMGRKRAGRRIASLKVLKKRAARNARKQIAKRLTKGIAKADLSPARKREIEKRLDKPVFKVKINRLVKRTIKDIRKKEIARKRK